jgi:hypothetical protein
MQERCLENSVYIVSSMKLLPFLSLIPCHITKNAYMADHLLEMKLPLRVALVAVLFYDNPALQLFYPLCSMLSKKG